MRKPLPSGCGFSSGSYRPSGPTAAASTTPDFIAVDRAGVHWIAEVKMDKEIASADVQAKGQAAERWANHVSADEKVPNPWRYLLASETDVATAHGSWPALAQLCGY